MPWKPVGPWVMIDVPAGFGRFTDIERNQPGIQIWVRAQRNVAAGRIRFVAANGVVVGESADGGFTPQDSISGGWRIFAWGSGQSPGAARMWTPAFDTARTLSFVDPAISCGQAVDMQTPIAGPFQITIPQGAKPGGRTVVSPASALIYGDLRHPDRGVLIATSGAAVLGKHVGRTTVNGGFEFGGAVFAYGTALGRPRLWTPQLEGRSTELAAARFVRCKNEPPPSEGLITVTKRLAPTTDDGLFDLLIDGAVEAEGVGEGGSTRAVSLAVGNHTVGEAAAEETNLSDYTAEIVCTEYSHLASPLSAAGSGPFTVPVRAGDNWQCTITNTRAADAPLFDGNATITADDAHRTTAVVGTEGGTLSTGGMTLTIPAGALLEDTELSMTPISALSGTPLDDSLLGGAVFAPEGIQFVLPATLTLHLPAGVSLDDIIAFAADGLGSNMHLVPHSMTGTSITMLVSHFSAGGASSGGASAAALMAQYTPSTVQQQVEQAIATTYIGPAPTDDPFVGTLFQAWYESTVRPGLQSAFGAGQRAFEAAAHEWLAWEGDVNVYTPDLLFAERTEARTLATKDAVELSGALLARCTGFVDYRPGLRDVIRLSAFLEVLGIDIGGLLYEQQPLPAESDLPTACAHVVIEGVSHAAVLAVNRDNTFGVNAGVAFWNGPANHSISLTYRLDDVTDGQGVPIDSDSSVNGQWQTSERPTDKGTWLLDLHVELTDAANDDSLRVLTAFQALSIPVRDRVELEALGAVDIRSGDSINLRARVAGDAMVGANVSYSVQGIGSLNTNSGTTDTQGVAPQFTYQAPATGAGNATALASFDGSVGSVAITVRPPIQITVDPGVVALARGRAGQFTATVLNATDPSVTWTATGGTINGSGFYTAGNQAGTFEVKATSNEDPSKFATATVVITAVTVTITDRLVSTNAGAGGCDASGVCDGMGDEDESPPGIGSFSVESTADYLGAFATAAATVTLTGLAWDFSAALDAGAITNEGGWISGSADVFSSVTFDVTGGDLTWHLTGSGCRVEFWRGQPVVQPPIIIQTTAPIDTGGTLAPGTYFFFQACDYTVTDTGNGFDISGQPGSFRHVLSFE